MISWIFGERCVRCGATRTEEEFKGLPTCEKCQLEIKSEREEKRLCPTCKTAMEKAVVLNVIIDKCSSCHGIWLDNGELDLMKHAIEAGANSNFIGGVCLGMAIG